MSKSDVRARAGHAVAFLTAADLVVQFGEDAGIDEASNLIGSLAVLAGIAASDAICGTLLGERAAGENHGEAIALLRRCGPRATSATAQLKRLLDAKTTTQYSPLLLGKQRPMRCSR